MEGILGIPPDRCVDKLAAADAKAPMAEAGNPGSPRPVGQISPLGPKSNHGKLYTVFLQKL